MFGSQRPRGGGVWEEHPLDEGALMSWTNLIHHDDAMWEETFAYVGDLNVMLTGLAAPWQLVPITAQAGTLAREDLSFALSVILLGLLMMISRRNAVSQVIGFMSIENGLILAATGAKGMPLVVEISVAFSILIAFIVIGIFLFRIRERFDTVDLQALERFRGEQP